MKTRNEKVIEVADWDALVIDTYGRPYSFQQQDGCKDRGREHLIVPAEAEDFANTTVPEHLCHEEMGVSFAAWLSRNPEQILSSDQEFSSLGLWWERNFYPNAQMVANDLHAKGLLEAGEYSIDIDW